MKIRFIFPKMKKISTLILVCKCIKKLLPRKDFIIKQLDIYKFFL